VEVSDLTEGIFTELLAVRLLLAKSFFDILQKLNGFFNIGDLVFNLVDFKVNLVHLRLQVVDLLSYSLQLSIR